MLLDEAALDEYTDRFAHDAFRHEVLTQYSVVSDGNDLARYLAGELGPDPNVVGPWGRWVTQQRARGATVRRLRVLHAPPSEYLRWELDWVYAANAAAGEDIRILDLTERRWPPEALDVEFWMLDGERAALMCYDEQGRFLHAETMEGRAAARFCRARDVAWCCGEPLAQWWARHPEYRRARV